MVSAVKATFAISLITKSGMSKLGELVASNDKKKWIIVGAKKRIIATHRLGMIMRSKIAHQRPLARARARWRDSIILLFSSIMA